MDGVSEELLEGLSKTNMNFPDLASFLEETATPTHPRPASQHMQQHSPDVELMTFQRSARAAERSTSFDSYPLQVKQEGGSVNGSNNDNRPSTSYHTSIDGLWSHFPPSYRSVEYTNGSNSSYVPSQSSSHTISSQSSSSTAPSTAPATEPTPTVPYTFLDLWQPSNATAQPARLQYTPGFPDSFTEMHPGSDDPIPITVKPVRSTEVARSREGDEDSLKKIEESIHCFWLVSENRMKQMQDELTSMASRLKASESEQKQISSHMAQVVPLQVQITEKAIRAAEERKLIFSRIKALEESTETWQNDFKKMLQEMQFELRASIETMLESAPKGRKPPAQKSATEASASTAASASAPASAAGTKGNNKRASPQSKKTAANAKKTKTQSKDDNEEKAATQQSIGTPPELTLPKEEDKTPSLSVRPPRPSMQPSRGPYDLIHSQAQLRPPTPNPQEYQSRYSSSIEMGFPRSQRGDVQPA